MKYFEHWFLCRNMCISPWVEGIEYFSIWQSGSLWTYQHGGGVSNSSQWSIRNCRQFFDDDKCIVGLENFPEKFIILWYKFIIRSLFYQNDEVKCQLIIFCTSHLFCLPQNYKDNIIKTRRSNMKKRTLKMRNGELKTTKMRLSKIKKKRMSKMKKI